MKLSRQFCAVKSNLQYYLEYGKYSSQQWLQMDVVADGYRLGLVSISNTKSERLWNGL